LAWFVFREATGRRIVWGFAAIFAGSLVLAWPSHLSGPQKLAHTSEVHIYRQKEGQPGQDDLKIDFDAIRKGKAPDVLLKPNDIIYVGETGLFTPKGLADMFKNAIKGSGGVILQRGNIY